MKAIRPLILLAVVMAACAANPNASPAAHGEKLYEAVAGGKQPMLAVIDSTSHKADRKLLLGAPSPDWKHVYTIVATSLVDTDAATGETINTVQLGAGYQLPSATANGVPGGLSPNGRWLVAESRDAVATRLLVIDTMTLKVYRHVAVPGNFEFDAIDNQATSLYLIQRLDGRDYYVRRYDLTAGSLSPDIIFDKSDGGQAMTGQRLSGVPSADGEWLFSIYVRAHQAPFIHALSLEAPFALCLDLAGRGYLDDPAEMNWSLAMSPDRTQVYAVNTSTGEVAVLSNDQSGPRIVRTARFTPATSTQQQTHGAYGAVVSAGMLIAGGPAGLTWIDVASLQVVARSIPGWTVATVGLSPDGKHLYAVSEHGRIAVITISSLAVDTMFDPLAGTPIALMRVAAS